MSGQGCLRVAGRGCVRVACRVRGVGWDSVCVAGRGVAGPECKLWAAWLCVLVKAGAAFEFQAAAVCVLQLYACVRPEQKTCCSLALCALVGCVRVSGLGCVPVVV